MSTSLGKIYMKNKRYFSIRRVTIINSYFIFSLLNDECEVFVLSRNVRSTTKKHIPKGVYLPISKLRSILTIPNLLAHNTS